MGAWFRWVQSVLESCRANMADNLFEGLPPPSTEPHPPQNHQEDEDEDDDDEAEVYPKTAIADRKSSPLPAPAPVLKSALKRPKPVEPIPDGNSLSSKSLAFETDFNCFSCLFISGCKIIPIA